MSVKYGSLPFQEQIAFFRQKTNIPTERWSDLWQEAHNRGFMVAGAMKADLLADFRSAVDRAISEGKSLNWFQREFKRIVKRYGWDHTGNANWRSQVIYDTNIRQSYSAGREQQIERIKHLRPYGIYKHGGSEHPRHAHLSWNNKVLPLDDPWWDTHTPQNGWGCKCKKFTASEADLKKLGLTVSQSPKPEFYEWIDPSTGEIRQVPKGIDPGFDYRPKSSQELTVHTQQQIESKPPLEERLQTRVVDHAYSTVKNVNANELSRVLAESDTDEMKLFGQFLKKHDTKTLFLKAGEMSGKAKGRALANSIEDYLQSGSSYPLLNYSTRSVSRTNGFTSQRFNHVVIKAKAADSFKTVKFAALQKRASEVIKYANGSQWSFSGYIKQTESDAARVLTTWIHEMGHQVHFKAGTPNLPDDLPRDGLTQYSQTNVYEFFAEHFVAWVLAPDTLKKHKPEIYRFITDAVEKSL